MIVGGCFPSEAVKANNTRRQVFESIVNLFLKENQAPSKEWIDRLPQKASLIEDLLFRNSLSPMDYCNPLTLKDRIWALAVAKRSSSITNNNRAAGSVSEQQNDFSSTASQSSNNFSMAEEADSCSPRHQSQFNKRRRRPMQSISNNNDNYNQSSSSSSSSHHADAQMKSCVFQLLKLFHATKCTHDTHVCDGSPVECSLLPQTSCDRHPSSCILESNDYNNNYNNNNNNIKPVTTVVAAEVEESSSLLHRYSDILFVSFDCTSARNLWHHIKSCTLPNCSYEACIYSRHLLNHLKECKLKSQSNCPLCIPVRDIKTIMERSINKSFVCQNKSSSINSFDTDMSQYNVASTSATTSTCINNVNVEVRVKREDMRDDTDEDMLGERKDGAYSRSSSTSAAAATVGGFVLPRFVTKNSNVSTLDSSSYAVAPDAVVAATATLLSFGGLGLGVSSPGVNSRERKRVASEALSPSPSSSSSPPHSLDEQITNKRRRLNNGES